MSGANDSLIPLADLEMALGLTPPVAPTLEFQIRMAAEGVSRLIRDYTGRMLTRGTYTEVFRERTPVMLDDGRQGVVLALTEHPVEQVIAVRARGVALAPTQYGVHGRLGRVVLRPEAWPSEPTGAVEVEYVGGYFPLPASLTLAFRDLVQRQLAAMGVDLTAAGGAAAAGAAPVKAVSIGSLKVDFAVAQASASSVQSGAASPLTEDVLASYASVLDLYRSVRTVAATMV